MISSRISNCIVAVWHYTVSEWFNSVKLIYNLKKNNIIKIYFIISKVLFFSLTVVIFKYFGLCNLHCSSYQLCIFDFSLKILWICSTAIYYVCLKTIRWNTIFITDYLGHRYTTEMYHLYESNLVSNAYSIKINFCFYCYSITS